MGHQGVFVFLGLAVALCTGSWYERYVDFFTDVVPNDPFLLELWQQHLANYSQIQASSRAVQIPSFQCHQTHAPNGHVPTSAHDIHPANIKVIAAMGDSLTAGMAILANSILQDLTEYRGHSFSIGGEQSMDHGVLTLPNILKKFDMGIYGYSIGTGGVNSAGAYLNLAHSGDVSANMPVQARSLVQRMKADANVDFTNDWKLVTLFIGGNDLCDYCHDHNKFSAASYGRHLQDALDYLHGEVPRLFVNLVEIFDIAPVAAMNGGFFCAFAHAWACDCGQDTQNANMLLQATRAYQAETQRIVDTGRYDTRDDFTVVVQPFFRNTVPPTNDKGEIDLSYFGPDCFHFSEKGHAAAALSLWNNMLEAVGSKRVSWHLNGEFHCPGTHGSHNHQYLTTSKNSGSR